MTEEPWNKHTPGDPMPCKCEDSVVEVELRHGSLIVGRAEVRNWRKIPRSPRSEITDWRFIERKGEDVIAADPYDDLEWDKDGIVTVVTEKHGRPEWVRDDDQVRFNRWALFQRSDCGMAAWDASFAFQIKRRQVLAPADPQLLALLAAATDDEADAIRSAARRANIEVKE